VKSFKGFNKLNKSTYLKVAITALAIIIVEIICGCLIYSIFSDHTYKEKYSEYSQTLSQISQNVSESLGDSVNSLREDKTVQQQTYDILKDYNNFSEYLLITEAGGGTIIGNDGIISGTLSNYGVTISEVATFFKDDTTYLFVPARIGQSSFYIGAVVDFTQEQEIITSMLHNLVATLIIASILILCAFIFYANWSGLRERKPKFAYKITLNSLGKVVKSNKKFSNDFGDVKELKIDLKDLNTKAYNVMRLRGLTSEKLLVIKLKLKSNGDIKIYANEIDNAAAVVDFDSDSNELTANGKAKESLSKTYSDFVKRGKRTLLGVITINNLPQITALFGKEMAQNIQKIVIKKVKEKFGYVYELDLGKIGIVYPDGKKLDNLLADIEDILRYIGQPIRMDDNLFTVELKCGFALCDATMLDNSFEYAMRAADGARQRALDTKIADYIIYHESQKKLYAKYFITYNIKDMLAEGAFEMEYQPQYNIKAARIEGFEALFRVKKSWNVNVDTFSFITYAERTGAMVQLGDFIFDTGMRFAKKLEDKNVSVSLNVSPVQLMQAGFCENFLKLYKKYDLKAGSICVEITESFLMTNFQETLKKLEILKNNGIYVHLDDFGTEYSSLLYIKTLPISTIKIDKEFIKDVTKNKESQAVIRFITNIAQLLSLTTICEGVETVEEFDMVNALGCDTIQGWLIGKSMKPDDALNIVDTFDYNAVVAAKKGK
jgi:EAL domain-containing protein (putative c-di-GMP-specific phosphodiesterase class I)